MPGTPLEDALVSAAGGDFGLTLIGFLVIALVGGFYFSLTKLLDQNQRFYAQLTDRMNEITLAIKDYHHDTTEKISKHDEQAACIKRTCERTQTLLESRPCIAGKDTKR